MSDEATCARAVERLELTEPPSGSALDYEAPWNYASLVATEASTHI